MLRCFLALVGLIVWTEGAAAQSSSGFTQVYILLDAGGSAANTQTPTSQQGSSYNGNGSRVIYISETSGSDSNNCTFASPCQTLAHGSSLMRNGKPDQLLLDCTDSTQATAWPTTDNLGGNGNPMPSGFGGGAVSGSVGGVITGPALISFYSPSEGTCTTRPMLLQAPNTNGQVGFGLGRSNGTYGSVALIGLNFYSYTRDPTNAAYTIAAAEGGTWAVQIAYNNSTASWTLVEDNKCSYQIVCLEPQGGFANAAGTVYIRRNIIVHTYSTNGGSIPGGGKLPSLGDSQCVFTSYALTETYDENFFAYCGWDPTLTAAQNVTISGNTITWPIANYAFHALPFPNNAAVYFQSACGSASSGTVYNVINVSGATFQVSATEGGAAVSLSGCSTATMMWADTTANEFNHIIYGDQLNNTITLTYNIAAFGNDLMSRSGGTDTGNFATYNNNNLTFGAFENCCGGGEPTIGSANATYNIIQHPAHGDFAGGHSTVPGQFSDGGDVAGGGFSFNNANGNDGSGLTLSNNLLSLFGSTTTGGTFIGLSCCHAGDVSNASFTNNIGVYGYSGNPNGISEDNDTNITVSWTCLDLAGTGCATNYPAPSTTDILSYDHVTFGTTCSNSSSGNWAYANTCWTDFESREETRPVQTLPSNLSACAIDQYIESVGFNLTYSCQLASSSDIADTNDFNGDGKSDILWRDTAGDVGLWLMNGSQIMQGGAFSSVPLNWSIVSQGDFNGDGKADILWRDTIGDIGLWLMNGTQIIQGGAFSSVPVNWAVVGIGDFNHDGKADILWLDNQGNVGIWFMNGTQILQTAVVGRLQGNWVVAGTDMKGDIFWRNATTGEFAMWVMNGTTVVQNVSFGLQPLNWKVAGIGDFAGTGSEDILWRDTAGDVAIWLMNGTQFLSSTVFSNVPTNWSIAQIGDYSGAGRSDILWRDTVGDIGVWFMNGTNVLQGYAFGNVGTNWTVQSLNAE